MEQKRKVEEEERKKRDEEERIIQVGARASLLFTVATVTGIIQSRTRGGSFNICSVVILNGVRGNLQGSGSGRSAVPV